MLYYTPPHHYAKFLEFRFVTRTRYEYITLRVKEFAARQKEVWSFNQPPPPPAPSILLANSIFLFHRHSGSPLTRACRLCDCVCVSSLSIVFTHFLLLFSERSAFFESWRKKEEKFFFERRRRKI